MKKSPARIPSAWARRNWVQVGPDRLGAGPARVVLDGQLVLDEWARIVTTPQTVQSFMDQHGLAQAP